MPPGEPASRPGRRRRTVVKRVADSAPLTLDAVRDWLAATASEAERAKLARYGIPDDRALGVPMGAMLALARNRPKDPALAAALWAEGGYETRTLAVLLDDPAALTPARMDAMVADSWAICDTACFRLLDRAPGAWEAVPCWAASDRPVCVMFSESEFATAARRHFRAAMEPGAALRVKGRGGVRWQMSRTIPRTSH